MITFFFDNALLLIQATIKMTQQLDIDNAIDYTSSYKFNRIHKRFMVLYNSNDMRYIWKKVRSEWKKKTKQKLPKRFGKELETWQVLNEWVEERIAQLVEEGGEDIAYLNKADLIERGWDNKIIERLYTEPDRKVYLGRGRYAYYYNGAQVGELEDSDEYIEHISAKLERQRSRQAAKDRKNRQDGFGTEFIR
jgi:hypothetical protein